MSSMDLDKDRKIAQTLRLAWPAFFQSFGRLTDVQRQAIPEIYQGQEILICSQTASGKTEAVCAPLVQRYVSLRNEWTILYICPTRALVNDLYYRLEVPLHRMGITLMRRTGDHRDNCNDIYGVLLTTPESFDSLMCRGRLNDGAGHVLANVVAVVLDEVHLLAGTPRGEQVRWLLERLRRLKLQAVEEGWSKSQTVQIVGLSATLENPDGVVHSFIPGGKVIHVHGQRAIEVVNEQLKPKPAPVQISLKHYLTESNQAQKVLVFCNTRRRVDNLAEELAGTLNKLNYVVKAHHGSLSQKMREEAEEASRIEERIVICTTSTLEIGVDIGDIDLVVLDGPAPDIPALLQRIGRGNRRSDKTRVMICSNNMAEAIIQTAMVMAAREGFLGVGEGGTQYAVAMQQIASYIFQGSKRARSRKMLQSFIERCIPQQIGQSILHNMIITGELIENNEGIRLGDDWLNKSSSGSINSNISSMPGAEIVDEIDGERIAAGIVYYGGSTITVGGQKLEVRRIEKGKIETRKAREAMHEGQWMYVSRNQMIGAGQAQSVKHWLGFEENEWPVVNFNEFSCIFHFGGGVRRSVIELLMSYTNNANKDIKCNEWFIAMPIIKEKPEWLTSVGPGMLEMEITSKIDSLERTLARPNANKRLPMDVRLEEIRSWLNLKQELEIIKDSIWNFKVGKETTDFLNSFILEFMS